MINHNVNQTEIYTNGESVLVSLKGRIVLEDCEQLRRLILPRIPKSGGSLYVDLSGVEFIDSAGLGLLVGLKMTSKKNNSLIVLLQPSKIVAEILYISKLDGIFEFATGEKATAICSELSIPENHISSTDNLQNQSQFTFESGQNLASVGFDGKLVGSIDNSSQETVEVYCRKAIEFMRQGDYEASVIEYKKALEIAPNYLPALNNIAIVYEKKPSWYPESIFYWEKVRELSISNGDQKHQDRAERHIANLKQMIV